MPELVINRNRSTATASVPAEDGPATGRPRRTRWLVAAFLLAVVSAGVAIGLAVALSPSDATVVLGVTSTDPGSGDCSLPPAIARAEGVNVADLCHPAPAAPLPDLRMR